MYYKHAQVFKRKAGPIVKTAMEQYVPRQGKVHGMNFPPYCSTHLKEPILCFRILFRINGAVIDEENGIIIPPELIPAPVAPEEEEISSGPGNYRIVFICSIRIRRYECKLIYFFLLLTCICNSFSGPSHSCMFSSLSSPLVKLGSGF